MAASTVALNQVAAASPALVNPEHKEESKKSSAEKQTSCGFKLVTNGPEEAADVLSLSMPVTAKYPSAFPIVMQQLASETLTAIVTDPKQAHGLFVNGVRKLNRKNWTKLVNAGKADAILNKAKGQSAADAAVAAVIEEEVMHERRVWLNEQLQQLIQRRVKQTQQSQN